MQDCLLLTNNMKGNSHKDLMAPVKWESIRESLKTSPKNYDFYFSWHKKKSTA